MFRLLPAFQPCAMMIQKFYYVRKEISRGGFSLLAMAVVLTAWASSPGYRKPLTRYGIFNGEDCFFHYKIKRGSITMKQKKITPEQLERQRLRARQYYQEHREYFRNYYQEHRVSISRKIIGEYCCRAIEKIRQKCPNKVERLLEQYPFEGFASKCLRSHRLPGCAEPVQGK